MRNTLLGNFESKIESFLTFNFFNKSNIEGKIWDQTGLLLVEAIRKETELKESSYC